MSSRVDVCWHVLLDPSFPSIPFPPLSLFSSLEFLDFLSTRLGCRIGFRCVHCACLLAWYSGCFYRSSDLRISIRRWRRCMYGVDGKGLVIIPRERRTLSVCEGQLYGWPFFGRKVCRCHRFVAVRVRVFLKPCSDEEAGRDSIYDVEYNE